MRDRAMPLWEEFGLERNPFEIKPVELFGYIPLDTFIGRKDDRGRLSRNIDASNRSISLIVGERGIGKTSLANRVKSDYYQDYFVLIEEIDCQSDWGAKEFIINLLANFYTLQYKIESYDDLPTTYFETAGEINDVLADLFEEESKEVGASAGVEGLRLGLSKASIKSLKNTPLDLLKSKFEEIVHLLDNKDYAGVILHYNNLDNLGEQVEQMSATLADLRDFLITDDCHFIFCGDRRMREAFRKNSKVSECIDVDIQLSSMAAKEIWSIIERRCKIFELEGRNHNIPVNRDSVEYATQLHNGNIRKVFSALETALIEMPQYVYDVESPEGVYQLNEPLLKSILSQIAEDQVSDDVTPRAMEVLQFIVNEDGEINNKSIKEEFDLDKSTVSNYLSRLKESNLITKSREAGARKYYKEVNEAVWLSITPENDTQAPLVRFSDNKS